MLNQALFILIIAHIDIKLIYFNNKIKDNKEIILDFKCKK